MRLNTSENHLSPAPVGAIFVSRAFSALFAFLAVGGIGGAVQAQTPVTSAPTTITVPLPARPPKDAVVLLSGKGDKALEAFQNTWYQRYTKDSAKWLVDKDGTWTPAKYDITSKQEFGDCYLHAEFRIPVDSAGKQVGHGNSGIGFQGRYEVQILGDQGAAPEAHGCGALYSQKPPIVNASQKAGTWQTYDILFRAPRFDANGQVVEKPRATVFQNGILVQNNEEFTGMTGIQYGEYKEMTKTGPIILQGDHDAVQYRNVWLVPIPAAQ